MLEKLLKRIGFLPETIDKAEVEDIVNILFTDGKQLTMKILEDLTGIDATKLNKRALVILQSRMPRANKPIDVINELERINQRLFGQEDKIKKLISSLPNTITPKYSTLQIVAICDLINNISTFISFQMDYIYLLLLKPNDEVTYGDKKIKEIWRGTTTYGSIFNVISNIESEVEIIKDLDNEIIINDGASAFSLMKNKNINFIPNNELIGTIYNIRTWFVDREIASYDVLKAKKELLEVKILEYKKDLANDGKNVKLIRAIEVYTEEVEKLEYRMKKTEG